MKTPFVDKKLWDEVAAVAKAAMHLVGGTTSIIFIEKEGAAAAVAMGDDDHLQKEKLIETLKMFRERIDDMIKNTEKGIVSLSENDKTFIRDSETGEYTEHDGFAC